MVVSPSWLPFFLPQPSVLAPTKGGAGCGPTDQSRPKPLRWPDYLLDLILYASTGQVGAWADAKRKKTRNNETHAKRRFHQTRRFDFLSRSVKAIDAQGFYIKTTFLFLLPMDNALSRKVCLLNQE